MARKKLEGRITRIVHGHPDHPGQRRVTLGMLKLLCLCGDEEERNKPGYREFERRVDEALAEAMAECPNPEDPEIIRKFPPQEASIFPREGQEFRLKLTQPSESKWVASAEHEGRLIEGQGETIFAALDDWEARAKTATT